MLQGKILSKKVEPCPDICACKLSAKSIQPFLRKLPSILNWIHLSRTGLNVSILLRSPREYKIKPVELFFTTTNTTQSFLLSLKSKYTQKICSIAQNTVQKRNWFHLIFCRTENFYGWALIEEIRIRPAVKVSLEFNFILCI